MRTIRRGDRGSEVSRLQTILKAQGFFKGPISGRFHKLTLEAVYYFQQTHLGPNGKPLGVDGILGPNTWWALEHPSGRLQKSRLPSRIPRRLTSKRKRQLEIALAEHDDDVHEDPDGSNWGDGVIKYGGQQGWPWCCLFWSWCSRECFGHYPLKARHASCKRAWEKTQTLGMNRRKGKYIPIPGDTFLMLYKDKKGNFTGKGHIGFVIRVRVKDGRAVAINTVEGNCGNRVKVGERSLLDTGIVGFINPFPAHEQPRNWERGLVRAASVRRQSTR